MGRLEPRLAARAGGTGRAFGGSPQAEATLTDGRADIVAVGRGFLDDPKWAFHAAAGLGRRLAYPTQYSKAEPGSWKGYRHVHRMVS